VKITHESTTFPKRLVALVTPVVKFPLSVEEEISLRHLQEYLVGFDRYLIRPQSLPQQFADFDLRSFPVRYFVDRFGLSGICGVRVFL
jgi:hypothetical protein